MEMVLVIQRRKSDFFKVSFSLVFRTDVKVFVHFPIPPLPVIPIGNTDVVQSHFKLDGSMIRYVPLV